MSIEDELARITAYAHAKELAGAPWWHDEDDQVFRFHGVMFRLPGVFEGWPDQVMNKQIFKAPKNSRGKYAEYWPDPADWKFMEESRTDLPRLLQAVVNVMRLVESAKRNSPRGYEGYHDIPASLVKEAIENALVPDTEPPADETEGS